MYGRYDSNVAGSAAVDYLEQRGDVDQDRLAVMGVSLGGVLRPPCGGLRETFQGMCGLGSHLGLSRHVEEPSGEGLQDVPSVPGEHINWMLGVDNIQEALRSWNRGR